jgi:hypothetical protein
MDNSEDMAKSLPKFSVGPININTLQPATYASELNFHYYIKIAS